MLLLTGQSAAISAFCKAAANLQHEVPCWRVILKQLSTERKYKQTNALLVRQHSGLERLNKMQLCIPCNCM